MKFEEEFNKVVYANVKSGMGVLIDVREKVEFKENSLPTAINMPLSEYDQWDVKLFNNRQVYIICHSGNRSKRIAKRLFQEHKISAVLVKDQMDKLSANQTNEAVKGWSIDRQFRMTLGMLLTIFLAGFYYLSPYFIIIPLVLATGLVITSIINRCYMRMGIALLPWNKNRK